MLKSIREKVPAVSSISSALASFAGSYTICHNICLALIAGLAIIGVTVVGMPLEFLQAWTIPLWGLGIAMFGMASYFYFQKKCISKHLMRTNAGVLIAAVPFSFIEPVQIVFWVVGFGIVGFAIIGYFKARNERRCH